MSSVVLLSGGLDSAVCLALRPDSIALTINYGQPHAAQEITCARGLAAGFRVELVEASVTIPAVPIQGDAAMFWPGRNLVLLSLAAALAQARGHAVVVIGANRDDHSGYPDCRPEFFRAAEPALGVKIVAPLLAKTKPQIGALARELGLPVAATWSCYFPRDDEPCGACDACSGRAMAFQ